MEKSTVGSGHPRSSLARRDGSHACHNSQNSNKKSPHIYARRTECPSFAKFPWPSAKMSHTGSSGAANAVRRSTSASSSGACRTFGRKVSGPRSTRSARVVSTLCFTQACGPRRFFGRFKTTFLPKLRVWARRRVIEALVEPVRHRAAQVVPAVAALIAARKELR